MTSWAAPAPGLARMGEDGKPTSVAGELWEVDDLTFPRPDVAGDEPLAGWLFCAIFCDSTRAESWRTCSSRLRTYLGPERQRPGKGGRDRPG